MRHHLYPLLTDSSTCIYADMADQFAFRPTGSTTACLIAILKEITDLLKRERYVRLIALDFTRAFDTVRISSLFSKMAVLPIQDSIYNWLLQFFSGRSHYTVFEGLSSAERSINASIIQGSVTGPIAYDINASDVHPTNHKNTLSKYADDGYLIVPASQEDSIDSEIDHIGEWAKSNNLRLNPAKSTEIIIYSKGSTSIIMPPPHPSIRRVTNIKILGVRFNNNLSMSQHITEIAAKSAQTLYALKILRSHGLSGKNLHQVCRSLLINRLTYASPSWVGFTTAEDKDRLQRIINRAKRWKLDGGIELPSISKLFELADTVIF